MAVSSEGAKSFGIGGEAVRPVVAQIGNEYTPEPLVAVVRRTPVSDLVSLTEVAVKLAARRIDGQSGYRAQGRLSRTRRRPG